MAATSYHRDGAIGISNLKPVCVYVHRVVFSWQDSRSSVCEISLPIAFSIASPNGQIVSHPITRWLDTTGSYTSYLPTPICIQNFCWFSLVRPHFPQQWWSSISVFKLAVMPLFSRGARCRLHWPLCGKIRLRTGVCISCRVALWMVDHVGGIRRECVWPHRQTFNQCFCLEVGCVVILTPVARIE